MSRKCTNEMSNMWRNTETGKERSKLSALLQLQKEIQSSAEEGGDQRERITEVWKHSAKSFA